MTTERNANEPKKTGLSARQERCAALLAAGWRVTDVAKECKASRVTLWTWTTQVPAFRARVDQLRKEITDRAVNRLADLLAGKALDVLEARLDARDEETGLPVSTVGDVKAVAETLINLTNAADLKARIEALEESNQPNRPTGRPRGVT
jgi:hypothetical protein